MHERLDVLLALLRCPRVHKRSREGEAGDSAGAVAATRQLLADRLRILGPDHPDTLATRHDLAVWQGVAGDPAGAAGALDGLLADYLRVFGATHRDTLAMRRDLAFWQTACAPDQRDTLANPPDLSHWRRRTSL
jgi:hypothetical protein